jgi:ADP-ribosylglycohydrolase
MQYSLFNRFCGVLLGAAIGEQQGMSVERLRSPLSSRADSELLLTQQMLVPCYSQWMAATAQSLIACQALDLADWQQRFPAQPKRRSPDQPMDLSEIAIATVPLVLFFHEDELKLRQALQSASQQLGGQPDSILGAWVVGFAIAQALQERLHLPLIEQILTVLPSIAPKTAGVTLLAQQLQQVQSLVSQRAGLETARTQLIRYASEQGDPKICQQTTAIALAFYCWLSTPNDSQLAVLRSHRFAYRSPVVGALTGALAGAYNGYTSLPANWCLAVKSSSQTDASGDSGQAQPDWLTLASNLLSTWSGTYDLHGCTTQLRPLPAIAAPRVIRPR